LDQKYFAVVQGGKEETSEVLKLKFDTIVYTGGCAVGKIVMEAASKHLTPVLLELGGKCPVIIDKDANLDVAVPRITWGKFINCGQVCLAPDYVLVHKSKEKEFLEKMKDCIDKFYSKNPKESQDYGKIINPRHTSRLASLLTGGTTFTGGDVDVEKCYIAPTLLTNVDLTSPLMQDEVFGPLLSVIPYDKIDEAIEFVNDRPKPLALYVFTKHDSFAEKVLTRTSSGGACVNEVILHNTIPDLRFGGVGDSGCGGYNGKYSFDSFTHQKGVMANSQKGDLSLRFPPFTKEKVGKILLANKVLNSLPGSKFFALIGIGLSILCGYFLWQYFK